MLPLDLKLLRSFQLPLTAELLCRRLVERWQGTAVAGSEEKYSFAASSENTQIDTLAAQCAEARVRLVVHDGGRTGGGHGTHRLPARGPTTDRRYRAEPGDAKSDPHRDKCYAGLDGRALT